MEVLKLTDGQVCDIVHALRQTAVSDEMLATQLNNKGQEQLQRMFIEQRARFKKLAEDLEQGEFLVDMVGATPAAR